MNMKKESVVIYPPKDSDSHMIKRKKSEIKKIEDAKKISIKEAGAYSLMDGFGLRYITPYALAVGANNTQIGFLSSLPSLLGNLSQLFTLRAMKIWSRRKIVFSAVLGQAIMWLVLLLVGVFYFVLNFKKQAPNLVILIYTILILFGAFGGPAWQSWMKDLVTTESGIYFGKRNKIALSIALVCMLIGGFILDYFKQTKIFVGFIILFLIAFIGRLISAYLIKNQYEPRFKHEEKYYFSFFAFIKRMRHNNFGKFVIYYALISFSVNITSPFLAIYMLKDLGFSYSYFMIVNLASVITTLFFVGLWGKFSDRYGNLKTINITGLIITIFPLLWLASIFLKSTTGVFIYLIIIELISGMIWAGFNLAAGNFIYDAVTRQRMAICTCYFNIISGLGVLLGATLGGFISSLETNIIGFSPLLFVFLLGGITRIIIYFLMNSQIKEVRKIKRLKFHEHITNRISRISNKITMFDSSKRFFESFGLNLEK